MAGILSAKLRVKIINLNLILLPPFSHWNLNTVTVRLFVYFGF